MNRCFRNCVVLALACAMSLTFVGCGGDKQPENQVPDNPAPLPDPSERIEG